MRLRKEDRDALVALLESEEYETAEGLAEAAWDLVLERLSAYGSYAVGMKVTETSVNLYGPMWSHSGAQKFSGALMEGGIVPFIYPLQPAVLTDVQLNSHDGMCEECGHLETLHVDKKWRPYVATKDSPLIDAGCGVFEKAGRKKERCSCRQTYGHFLGDNKSAWKGKRNAA